MKNLNNLVSEKLRIDPNFKSDQQTLYKNKNFEIEYNNDDDILRIYYKDKRFIKWWVNEDFIQAGYYSDGGWEILEHYPFTDK